MYRITEDTLTSAIVRAGRGCGNPGEGAGQVLLSSGGGKIKDNIMDELELEVGFKSDKDLQKRVQAIPGQRDFGNNSREI